MGDNEISKSLNNSTVSKFVTRIWTEVNDLLSSQYYVNKNIWFQTPMIRSDLCDYCDAYIVVKGRINITGTDNTNRRNKKLIFQKNAPFSSCITKINNSLVDNAGDLDFVVPMYNLFEYSDNYSATSGSFWNHCRNEVNDDANENNPDGNYSKATASKIFECETKKIGSTPDNNSRLDPKVVVLLNYLSNFWRSLDLSLINGEIGINLQCSRKCVIFETSRVSGVARDNLEETTLTTGAAFQNKLC